MSEEIEIPKPARKPRATKKVAASAPDAVISENISEATTPVSENVINPNPVSNTPRVPRSNTRVDGNNVVGSGAADRALQKIEPVEQVVEHSIEENKKALWSEKNISWHEVGKIVRGYNIVTKEAADKWLTLNGIRTATPEEIATYYGK
jgi:hypothetical protein